MFLKWKGKYIQVWDYVDGKQRMIEHLGSMEFLVKVVREYKQRKKEMREQKPLEKEGTTEQDQRF